MKKFLIKLFRWEFPSFFTLIAFMTAFCVLSSLFLVNTNWEDLESQDFFYLILTLAVVLLIFLLFLIIKYNLAYEGKVTVKREKSSSQNFLQY